MQQEANKKSKKWLWLIIAIVAVLAVVGVVLGIVLSGPAEEGPTGDENNGPKGGRADIYWNIDKASFSNATTGMSAREPGADGKYHVTFAHDGEQVEYVFTDKRLVNYIDTVDAVGLVFDDNGNVVDAKDVTTIAKEMAKGFYVVKVEGNVITLNGSATLDGLTKQITCTENTKVMNFAGPRETKGELIEPADVRPLDMVFVYGNDLDEATHFAVMTSPVESAIYWRVQQFYNYGERMTTRVPDENGIYTVEMFCNGERLSLKFRNVEDVNMVDKVTQDIAHIGLIFDQDGYVVGTQPSQNGIRGRIACEQFDVTEVNGNTFTATKVVGEANLIGNTYTGTLPEGVGIYDTSSRWDAEKRGLAVDGLKVGDRITVWEDTLGNIKEIYIYIRRAPGPVYYKTDSRGANRLPDEDGWYTITYFGDGKFKNLKTKNETLIRWLEQNQLVGFILDGDVVKDAFSYTNVVGHGYVDYGRYNYTVSSVAGMIVTLVSPDGGTMLSKIVNPACKIYNLSGIHQERGAETTIQPGDRGLFVSDASGQMVYAFINERKVDAEVYYNLSRRYDSANKCTARVPDDNGYYVFEMAHNGKVVTIKTKSKAVATKIDEIANCIVGLNPNSKGIVTDAYRGTAASGGQVLAGGQWQFECVLENGNIQLQRADLPESKEIVKPAEGMKVFNVATVGFSKFRGEADKLEPGDHVQVLTDANGKTIIAYIIKMTFKDVTRFCEHCNKKVKFVPWSGTNFSLLPEASGHYYVPANGEGCSTSILGDVEKEKGDDIVIDLNGKTMEFAEGQGRFFIYNEVKVTLLDTVGGGKMINPLFYCGGLGGKMDIYGGTYELPAQHQVKAAAGVLAINGSHGTTVNFYGGKFVSKDPKIEAIAIKNSNVNIHSGFVCDSTLTVGAESKINMSGTVKIAQLKIDKGILLDFTKLNSKSKIGVVARGVFTTEMSASQLAAAQKIISCPVKGGSIVVEGNQLACYGTEPDYTQIYENSLKMDFSNTEKLPTTCPYCDRGAVWEPLPEPNKDSKWYPDVVLGGGKHYYLDKNRTVEGVYMVDGGDICLHLNGKTITSTGCEIFTIFKPNTLTVMGKGTMSGSGSSEGGRTASVISNNWVLNLCGGTYVATEKGNMPIIANRGDAGNQINVYDGTIKTDGVAIKARMRDASVFGGTVEGAITTETQNTRGGNIVLAGGSVGSVKITKNGTLEISGAPKVSKVTLAEGVLAKIGEMKSGAMIGIDAEGVFTTAFETEAAADAALAYFTAAEEGATLRREGTALFCEPAPFNFKAVAQQAKAMKFPTDSSTYTADCPYCEENVQWTPLSSVVDRYNASWVNPATGLKEGRYEQFLYEGRHYYADKNFTLTHAAIQTVSGAPCVHLNGKSITGVGRNVFISPMTIMGNGTVSVTKGENGKTPDGVVHPNGGVVNVFGGTYTTADDVFLGIGVIQFHGGSAGKGTLNFYDGEIKAINSDAIRAWNRGTVNIYGGKITGCHVNAHYAGMEPSTFNIYGGEIDKITHSEGTLNIEAGKIGSITVAKATADSLKISGTPTIAELKFMVDVKADATGLTTGASIGVNANGVFTTDFADETAAEAAKGFFSAVQSSASIERQGSALACVGGGAITPDAPPPAPEPEFNKAEADQIIAAANAMTFPADGSDYEAKCPHCDKVVIWKGLTSQTTIDNSGHFYVANDIIEPSDASRNAIIYMATWENGTPDVCLHLNGKTVRNTRAASNNLSAICAWTSFNLNIMGEGTVSTMSMNWAALRLCDNGNVNVYGGSYDNDYGNKHTISIEKGNANIYNAEITAGKLTINSSGGNVIVYDGNYPIVNTSNSTGRTYFLDGTYGTVTLNGALNVKGGTITKLVAKEGTSLLSVSDKAVINELDLTACNVKLTVGELKSGAEIKVKAKEGVFTGEFKDDAAATAAKAFFTGISGEVKVEGKALAFTPATTPGGGTEPPTPGPGTNPEPDEPDDPVVLTPAEIIAAANAMTFPADKSDKTATCPACGQSVTWKALRDTADDAMHTINGHYYLAEDLVDARTAETIVVSANGKLCLHLNGKSISAAESGSWSGAIRGNVAGLNIMGSGTINGNASAAVWANGPTNIYGGTYTTTSVTVFELRAAAGEAINFYAGAITSGRIRMNGDNATFNMYGGEFSGSGVICGNAAKTGMKVNIYDGAKITATGGITTYYINLDISGGEISKIVTNASCQSFKLSGEPKITELDMSVINEEGKIQVGELGTNASIGIKANGVFTKDFADAAAAKAAKGAFTSLDVAKGVDVDGKALTCIDASLIAPEVLTPEQIIAAANAMTFPTDGSSYTATCPACGKRATWIALSDTEDATTVLESGHYYLAEDIVFNNATAEAFGYYIKNAATEICLHMNGKTISADEGDGFTRTCIRISAGNLNLMGGGLLTNNATNWAALDTNGNVTVYGVNAFNNAGNSNRRAVNVKNGLTNLHGVTIEKGWIYVTGGVVNVESGSYEGVETFNDNATVNVKAGTLSKVNAIAGTLEVAGGTINTMTVKDTAGTTTISGAPVITTLDMTTAGDVKLVIGELTEGASIAVKAADGAFTTAFANEDAANAARQFISAKESGKAVTVKENALVIVDASQIDPNEAIILAANAMKLEPGENGARPKAVCPKCGGPEVEWWPLSALVDSYSQTNQRYEQFLYQSKHYYLDTDVTLNNAGFQSVSGIPCVLLNGKTITANSGKSALIGAMNIMGKGTVIGNVACSTGLVSVSTTTNIYGGTYTVADGVDLGAAILQYHTHTVNFYAGEIVDPNGTVYGVDFYGGATFNMYGGTISGKGLTTRSWNNAGTGNIYGGTISAVQQSDATYHISGGNIGTYTVGNGATATTISGNPVIGQLTLGASAPKLQVGTLTEGASITVASDGVFTTAFANETVAKAAAAYFNVPFGKEITVDANALKCAARTAPYTPAEIVAGSKAQVFTGAATVQGVCYKCMQQVTWTAITQDTFTTGVKTGHYYLAENITNDQNTAMFNATSTLCLHLNGKSITTTGTSYDARCFNSGTNGVINIFDSENGSVNGNATSAAVWVNGGTVNAYGGTYTATVSYATLEIRKGSFNLYDGVVAGSMVRMNNANAEFNMYGGEFSGSGKIYGNVDDAGKVSIYGGTVSATGGVTTRGLDLVICGGTINKVVADAKTASIDISGKPVITNLDMTASAVKATVGTLETDASIGVTADGVFTGDIADVNAAKAFFSAVANGKTIEIVGQTLSCVNAG